MSHQGNSQDLLTRRALALTPLQELLANSQHPLQLIQIRHDLPLQPFQSLQYHLRVFVLFFLVHHFLVAVDGQVVLVGGDIGGGDDKGFLSPVTKDGVDAGGLEVAFDHLPIFVPLGNGVGQVVAALTFQFGTFVVQRVAVGLQIVEPYPLGGATLGKNQDGGADTGVGFEYTAGQADDAFQLVVFQQLPAQLLVGLGGAEQHAVRYDHGGAAAELERAQDVGDKQQLGLFGFHQAEHVGVGVGFVQAALEWRVGQHYVKEVLFLLGVVFLDRFAQGVLVADVCAVHPMQHHVHAGHSQHGGIEVEAPEHVLVDMFPIGFQQVTGVMPVTVLVGDDARLAGVLTIEVFHGAGEKACGTAGRIADNIGRLRCNQLDHGVDDVARRAELAVDAGGGQFAQQVFIDIALHITLVQRQVVDHFHGGGKHRFVLDLEIGIFHVFADMPQAFQGAALFSQPVGLLGFFTQFGEVRVDLVFEVFVQLLAAHVAEVLPAQQLAIRGIGEQPVEGLAGAVGLALGDVFLHVEHAGEHQVADLFDHGQRVGDAAGPEFFPEFVYVVTDFASEHWLSVLYFFKSDSRDAAYRIASDRIVHY